MDELCHYGIKGQKWGVRRFQNSDGSYTSEGKRRAQQQEKKDPVKEMKDEDLRKAITRLSLENKYKDLTKSRPRPPSLSRPRKLWMPLPNLSIGRRRWIRTAARLRRKSGWT